MRKRHVPIGRLPRDSRRCRFPLPCHPSYNTIAADTGTSKNTVIKSVGTLLDKGLIGMGHSRYIAQRGMKWKVNNLYTLLPIKRATDSFYQQQLCRPELDARHRAGLVAAC